MVQLTIKVTKEILERSKNCQPTSGFHVGQNCAVALAVRDIFPQAYVSPTGIHPFCDNPAAAIRKKYDETFTIILPPKANLFIAEFDFYSPEQRLKMPELEFTVDIPDAVIDRINIDEIRPLLVNHPTLTLIEA